MITRTCDQSLVTNWFTYECEYYKRAKANPRPDNLPIYGWPDNLLVPKGNLDGYPVQLFVMISAETVSLMNCPVIDEDPDWTSSSSLGLDQALWLQ